MSKCPWCRAARYDLLHDVLFKCSSRPDKQSEYCRIRELEAQLRDMEPLRKAGLEWKHVEPHGDVCEKLMALMRAARQLAEKEGESDSKTT